MRTVKEELENWGSSEIVLKKLEANGNVKDSNKEEEIDIFIVVLIEHCVLRQVMKR